MKRVIDLKGQKFGRLRVISRAETPKGAGGHARWLCQCECEQMVIVKSSPLKSGATKSCGCLNRERVRSACTTHGKTKTTEFSIWQGMLTRCTNQSTPEFPRYGGRGILVCERWKQFENFLADMGPRPKDKTLDRIDNEGNYEPKNCRWATRSEQQRNRSVNAILEVNGERLCVAEWAQRLGINSKTIFTRLRRGWSAEDALIRPNGRGCRSGRCL